MAYTGEGCKLTIKDNRIQYPRGIDNLYEDLKGYLQYSAFHKKMIRLGNRKGIEYGIIGSKKYREDFYGNSGYIGYKIECGNVYITRFTPTSKAKASKWVREEVRSEEDRWILLGEIKEII